jgi:hypothetical protein
MTPHFLRKPSTVAAADTSQVVGGAKAMAMRSTGGKVTKRNMDALRNQSFLNFTLHNPVKMVYIRTRNL